MILDRLDHAGLYAPLSPGIAQALAFLARPELADLPDGRHDIAGDDVFALVSRYLTKPREEGVWEAHRRYIDLQHVVAGVERLGHAHPDRLTAGVYAADSDYLPLAGTGDLVTLAAGGFALLFPHDAHMPGLAVDHPGPVHKVVIKIAVAPSSS